MNKRFTFESRTVTWLALAAVVVAAAWYLGQWMQEGLAFHARVLPFYDSLSYQAGFNDAARLGHELGAWRAVIHVWQEPGNNVVLYKLFAAATSGVLPAGKLGLYLYLFTIHITAAVALFVAVAAGSRSVVAAILALAAFIATWPFTQALNGVLDQRMDLASASFYTAVVALALHWSRRPSPIRAAVVGFVVALALLHRPVMGPATVALLGLCTMRGVLSHREQPTASWVRQALVAALPVLVIAAPWFITHAKALHHYYFEANVDVGSAKSWSDALSYNVANYWLATGYRPVLIVVGGLAWILWRRGLDRWDAAIVLAGAVVPIALLVASRSVGNFLVCQQPLGMPALLLAVGVAAGRPRAKSGAGQPVLALAVALAVLGWVGWHSLAPIRYQVAVLPPNTRTEALAAVRQISTLHPGGRLAGFQIKPADVMGLIHLARDERIDLAPGTLAYHPQDFGLADAIAGDLSSDAVEAAVAGIVDRMATTDDFLILPATEAMATFAPVPYSHRLIPLIRDQVSHDARFHPAGTLGPIDGVAFDLFTIVRR